MQRHYREERRDSVASKEETFIRAKLLKFVITKLNSTDLDWLRFLNQIQAEIDSSIAVSNLMKFSYP